MASTFEAGRLLAWRLVKARHGPTAFDGEGARLFGGRWNTAGHRMVYTSQSLALAALETLVHLDAALPLPRLVAFAVEIDVADVETLKLPDFSDPAVAMPDLVTTRRLGDAWIDARRSLALIVPSFVVPQERNVLLNPAHPRFAQLSIGTPRAFSIDPRLRPSAALSQKTNP